MIQLGSFHGSHWTRAYLRRKVPLGTPSYNIQRVEELVNSLLEAFVLGGVIDFLHPAAEFTE